MNEEEVLKTINNMLVHAENQLLDYEALAIQGLLDLYNKEKEKNEKLERQMGKDLDIVYIKGIYDERDKWENKIKAKIEEVDKDENASIPDFIEYAKEYATQKLQSLLEKE